MRSSEKHVPSIGQLALRYGTITRDQLMEAQLFIKEKVALGDSCSMEEILIEKKIATRYQVKLLQLIRDFLVIKKKGEQFGQIAVEKGYATSEEVELALTRQQQLFRDAKVQKMLGDLLVEFGVITEEQQQIITEEQARLEAIPFEPPAVQDRRAEPVVKPSGKPFEPPDDGIELRDSEKEFLQLRALDTDFALRVLEKGFATVDAVESAMATQNEWFEQFRKLHLLGDIMISEGVLTEEQKTSILMEQKRSISSASTDNKKRVDSLSNFSDKKPSEPLEPLDPLDPLEGIDVVFSDSLMEAWIRLPEPLSETDAGHSPFSQITPNGIRLVLEEKGITSGICSDGVIQSHLDRKERFFPVALGEHLYNLVPQYQFDIHHREKNALLKKNNTLAYLDTQHVDVVVRDVMGKPVDTLPIPANRSVLRCGNGVTLSEDGLRLVALTGGFPALSVEGFFHILPVVNILGDADVRYGPIDAYASINVAGILTGAYRLHAGDVKAKEIRGCTLEAVGDVTVEMGITGCTIAIQGSLRAKYIHNCRIEAFGDVCVEHEIIDSTIIISGACRAPKSRIIASLIAARQGIVAAGVGSDVTEVCQLKVGREDHIVLQSLKITRQIRESEETLSELLEKRMVLKDKNENLFKKMVELKLLHDRANKKALMYQKELGKGNLAEGTESHDKTVRLIDALNERMASSISALRRYNKQKKQMDAHLKKMDSTIEVVSTRVKKKIFSLEMDRNRFFQWVESRPASPEIVVSGRIVQGTRLSGVFASIILDDDYHNVNFSEKLKKAPSEDYRIHMKLL